MSRIPVEIIFEVEEDPDGGFIAQALGEAIFTEAKHWTNFATTFGKP